MVEAARSGEEEKIATWLDKGGPVDATCIVEQPTGGNGHGSRAGFTMLMIASASGRSRMIGMLLRRGAQINQRDAMGETALNAAIVNGHSAVVRRLLQAGASHDHRNSTGQTALEHARQLGKTECVRAILEATTGLAMGAKGNGSETLGGSVLAADKPEGECPFCGGELVESGEGDDESGEGDAACDDMRCEACDPLLRRLWRYDEEVGTPKRGGGPLEEPHCWSGRAHAGLHHAHPLG